MLNDFILIDIALFDLNLVCRIVFKFIKNPLQSFLVVGFNGFTHQLKRVTVRN